MDGKTNMKKNKVSVFEIIVTVVIALVVVQTFLEDFSVIIGWNTDILNLLLITGFFFDLFFTIEFLIRLYNSRHDKGVFHYFLYNQGWVDFCASIPLLMFSSGPQILSLIQSSTGVILGSIFVGFISMLKLIKIIRIARILRLLRFIKIFRSIKYTDSPMAQRHLRKIITIGVTILVLSFLGFTIVVETIPFSNSSFILYEFQKEKIMAGLRKNENSMKLDSFIDQLSKFEDTHSVLIVRVNGKVLYTRFTQDIYDADYTYNDYEYKKENGNIEVFFDVKEEKEALSRLQSRDNLIFFFIVLVFIFGCLIIYSPHFALTISDPVYVMKRGMDEKNYNLEVKIPQLYKDDDIFKLAQVYNEGYLPLKDRSMSSDEMSVLDMGSAELTDLIDE